MELTSATVAEISSYVQPTLNRILRRHRDHIPDVLQNALLKAHINGGQFEHRASFKAYFCRIVINEALMFLRSNKQTFVPIEDVAGLFHHSRHPELLARQSELRGILLEEINRLSALRRQAILRLLAEEPANDCTRKARRFSARREIREALTARGVR